MTERPAESFAVVNDELLASTLAQARQRVVLVAPAVWQAVAEAICDRLKTLGADRVAVVLDSDPEVYRLGYGELAALEVLQETALAVGAEIRRQPGVRIGLVVADHTTLIFVPTPKLIEAGPNTSGGANAIRLTQAPQGVERDLGLDGSGAAAVGRVQLGQPDIDRVKADIDSNPPLRFDLARKLTVFNAFIEFVDLKVRGTEIGRRTASIPNHLLAGINRRTRQQLQARFRIVPEDDDLSGKALAQYRQRLIGPFLHAIPGFGNVVLHRDKPALEKAVEKFHVEVAKFAEAVKNRIQARIDTAVTDLIRALRRPLMSRPPTEWLTPSGERPSAEEVEQLLESELRRAFGNAEELASTMSVKCIFRGVTYELLTDPAFLKAATKVLPDFEKFHREFAAVEAEQPPFRQAALLLD
jgi:hypothetical protein